MNDGVEDDEDEEEDELIDVGEDDDETWNELMDDDEYGCSAFGVLCRVDEVDDDADDDGPV